VWERYAHLQVYLPLLRIEISTFDILSETTGTNLTELGKESLDSPLSKLLSGSPFFHQTWFPLQKKPAIATTFLIAIS
jgi:hypothetical protein